MEGVLKDIGAVFYSGIRPNIPGQGGEECIKYLSPRQIVGETLLATTIMVVCGSLSWRTFTMAKVFPKLDEPLFKRLLLTFMCILFGIEAGYKICHQSALFLLNPCHVITMIQIYLLAAKPGKLSFSVLRIMIHLIYGAMVAMLFPETQSRNFPGELLVYWLQHIFIFFIIPPYLVWLWGPKTLEPFKEWAWAVFAGIIFGIHHLYIMQPIAMITHVNMNYVMCPASVDPFSGPYYRLCAVFHQSACLLTLGKAYTVLLRLVLHLISPLLPTRETETKED